MLCTFVYLYRFLFFLNSAWFAETSENPDHRKSDMQTEVHRELRTLIRAEENDL